MLKVLKSILPGFLILLLASACAANSPASPTPTTLPQADLDAQAVVRDFLAGLPQDLHLAASRDVAITRPFILDVRQPEEYSQGFIEHAVNIPLRELTQNLQSLPTLDQDIIVVDDTGHRSAIGMSILQMLGYKKAKSLDGGLLKWQEEQLALVTTPVHPRPTGQAPTVDPRMQALLDYYLLHTLPYDWGIINAAGLTADQQLLSSAQMDIQSETYDQGPSLLVDVDTPEEFARLSIERVINVPLRQLPETLDNMPLRETIEWA